MKSPASAAVVYCKRFSECRCAVASGIYDCLTIRTLCRFGFFQLLSSKSGRQTDTIFGNGFAKKQNLANDPGEIWRVGDRWLRK
jgi:hypothetical protein